MSFHSVGQRSIPFTILGLFYVLESAAAAAAVSFMVLQLAIGWIVARFW
jgi:hypothetical protein